MEGQPPRVEKGEANVGRLSPERQKDPCLYRVRSATFLGIAAGLPIPRSLDSREQVRGVMQLKGLQVRVREIHEKRAGGTERGAEAQSEVC